ncbi:hypothetical protein [Bacillus wiedmannii]|uniref:hypothetical protein n=1 Tax=Bacillus wiedmannii TaxID=1890302 RepID=UPI000BEF98C9|nr:hypothetical protein [Bacillus wiedmannii]PEK04754.1 hypothetical protein CN690_00185 [Bacillus wiedmannii]
MDQEKKQNRVNDIEFYYEKNRFFNLLFVTKKYRDMYKSKEAVITFLLTVITVYSFTLTLTHETDMVSNITNVFSKQEYYVETVVEPVRSLLLGVAGGFFSLLGFSIGGLAILTGTIDNATISNLRKKGKIDHFMSVIFNFYFAGALTGLSIILCLLTYAASFTKIQFNFGAFLIGGFVITYLIFFSIIYSVMLLGTCIRLFLLKYFYADISDDN